jgi:hypothetical protein
MRRIHEQQVQGYGRRHRSGRATTPGGWRSRSGRSGRRDLARGDLARRDLGRWVAVASALVVAALALTHAGPLDSSSAATAARNGAAGEDCAAVKLSEAQWWYNWYVDPGCDAPNYVPMVSGRDKQTQGDIQWQVDRAYSNGYRTLLGFNEPNQPGQSVMSVDKALDLWPTLTSHDDVVVGSPAVSGGNGGTEWLTSFMQGVDDRKLRVDFVAAHFYGWGAGSCTGENLKSYLQQIQSLANGRPVWVTEFGCLDASNTDEKTVRQFYNDAVKVLEDLGIERWCWYTPEKNHALVDGGKLTGLGQDFVAISQQ